MKQDEQQFADLVRRNRSTIYTVCYMFSKDNDEVADIIGITPKNVSVRLVRIREQLKRMNDNQ